MDRDKDARLTYEEFVEGSKQDPTIVQVLYPVHFLHFGCQLTTLARHCLYTMGLFSFPPLYYFALRPTVYSRISQEDVIRYQRLPMS